MTAPVRALDVSTLPTTVFGHRSHMWWGTLGFMLIEGTTLLVCVASYFYLRLNFTTWPKLVTGKTPGTNGTLIPAARHRSRNLR